MAVLDHLIVRVRDAPASAQFYADVLGFVYEGRAGPFQIVRVNEGLTLDLLGERPQDFMHLAFTFERAEFNAIHRRLIERSIPYASTPFNRDGGPLRQWQGARGLADAWYFDDPDGHAIEVRCYA